MQKATEIDVYDNDAEHCVEVNVTSEKQQEVALYNYEEIIDELFEWAGGKEYCLKQILPEGDYKKFAKSFVAKHEKYIYAKLEELYEKEKISYNKGTIINLEISPAVWNKYMMKFYYFDKILHRLFEYDVKTKTMCEKPLYEDNTMIYSKSFLTQTKNGSALWAEIEKEQNQKRKELQEVESEKTYSEMIETCRFMSQVDFKKLDLSKSNLQYRDGFVRYTMNKIYYYSTLSNDGEIYFTFDKKQDFLSGHITIFDRILNDQNIDKCNDE